MVAAFCELIGGRRKDPSACDSTGFPVIGDIARLRCGVADSIELSFRENVFATVVIYYLLLNSLWKLDAVAGPGPWFRRKFRQVDYGYLGLVASRFW